MHVTLNLTHACNLACSYCFAGEARSAWMPEETGRDAIDWAIRQTMAEGGDAVGISFFGGEPLLAWDLLVGLTRYARDRAGHAGIGVRFQVTTNATLLDDERLDMLARHDFSVALSIDGIPEAHDRTRLRRGGQKTGTLVWETLDRSLSRLDRVSVVHVVDPANVVWLDESVTAFTGRGVRNVVLNPNWSADWHPESLDAWRDGYETIAIGYTSAYRAGRPFALNIFDEKIDLRIRGEGRPVQTCGFDFSAPAVAPSGRMYSCGRAIGEDRSETNCERLSTPQSCLACAHRPRCASRCACANREATGDASQPGDVLCWHERMSIPIADRAAAALFAERNPQFLTRFYGGFLEVSHALGAS